MNPVVKVWLLWTILLRYVCVCDRYLMVLLGGFGNVVQQCD